MRIGAASSSTRDCNGHATRYPALYLDTSRNAIQFALSNTIDCWGVGLLNASLPNLLIGHHYALRITYNASRVRITADDAVIFDGARRGSTPSHLLGSLASIMIADSVDTAANVTLRDIVIQTYDGTLSDTPTPSPTRQPTFEAFVADIEMFVEYDEDATNSASMHPKMLDDMFTALFPASNMSTVHITNVVIDDVTFNVSARASVFGDVALAELVAFLHSNLSVAVVQHALPESARDVVIEQLRHEVRMDGQLLSSGLSLRITPSPTEYVPSAMESLPFGEVAVYILMAALVLFGCSALISIGTICYFCRMRNGSAWKYRRTHRLDGVKAKRWRRTTDQCEDGDGDGTEQRTENVFSGRNMLATSVLSPRPMRPMRAKKGREQYETVGTLEVEDDTLAATGMDLQQFVFAMPTLDDTMSERESVRSSVQLVSEEVLSDVMALQLLTNDQRLGRACEMEQNGRECEETDDEETMDVDAEEDASHEAMYDEGGDDEPCGTRTNTMDTTQFCGASGSAGSARTSSRHPSYF